MLLFKKPCFLSSKIWSYSFSKSRVAPFLKKIKISFPLTFSRHLPTLYMQPGFLLKAMILPPLMKTLPKTRFLLPWIPNASSMCVKKISHDLYPSLRCPRSNFLIKIFSQNKSPFFYPSLSHACKSFFQTKPCSCRSPSHIQTSMPHLP